MIEYVKRLAGPFTAEGATNLPFGFKIFDPTDVFVAASTDPNTSSTALVYGKDYSVKMNEDQDTVPGGTVVLSSPISTGQVVVIGSAVAYTQNTQLTNFSRFPPEIINESLDRIVVQIQQLVELTGRTISLPPTSSLTVSEFLENLLNAAKDAANSADEAAQYARICEEIKQNIFIYSWDIPHVVDTLDDVEKYPYDGFFAVGGYGDPGHHGQDISNRLVKTTGSTELRTLGERFADVVNVKDFGAKGDGVTDDTKAFEAATLAVAKRGLVLVPSGNYKLNKTIVGMFLSVGNVRTTEPIDFIDLNFFKTRQFKDRLSLGMAFTYPVPWESQDSRFYLQGFCSDNDDFVFFGMRTQSHSAQKIVRYSMSTGEVLVKDFTALWHVNAMTYCDGKVYVTPMNASLPNVVVLNAATLERERDIVLTDVPAAGGALAYDSYTDRFYYYANAAVWVFDTTWRLQKKIAWQYPDWTPPVGQAYGAYKGLLFFARSANTTFPTTRHEAILVFDTDKCEVVWQWFIGGSYGELESVAFFKNKLLLGFNDGSHEVPFYLAEFDMASKYSLPQPTEELLRYNEPFFGNLSQETVKIYCDASAPYAGDGTEERPFNSLKRALWAVRQVGTPYRAILYVSGDVARNPFEYVQGSWRLLQILPWAGKAPAVIPPLRIFDSTVRITDVTVKGVDSYSGTISAINAENSSIDLRGTKFNPDGSELSPNRYVNILRGELLSTGLDFSLTGGKLPSVGFVTVYGGGALCLLSDASSFIFPVGSERIVKFAGYGVCTTQFANCRSLIQCYSYTGSKTGTVFDSDGTGTQGIALLYEDRIESDDWSQEAEASLGWFKDDEGEI